MTDVSRFLEDLRRQQAKYRELAALAQDQKRILAESDMDALLAIVERKRSIMAEIDGLEKLLAPTKGRWAELRGTMDEPAIREVEQAVEETRQLLQELVRLEDEAREVLERRRVATADELRALMTKKRARGAYGGGAGSGPPRFIDGQN